MLPSVRFQDYVRPLVILVGALQDFVALTFDLLTPKVVLHSSQYRRTVAHENVSVSLWSDQRGILTPILWVTHLKIIIII